MLPFSSNNNNNKIKHMKKKKKKRKLLILKQPAKNFSKLSESKEKRTNKNIQIFSGHFFYCFNIQISIILDKIEINFLYPKCKQFSKKQQSKNMNSTTATTTNIKK